MKSVRLRLLILALLPLVVVMPLLLAGGMNRWASRFDALLITNVESDLRIAEQYLQRILTINGNEVRSIALSANFQDEFGKPDAEFKAYLEGHRTRLGLDFLQFLTPEEAVARSDRWPVVKSVIKGGSRTEIDIFEGSDLLAISPDLADQAAIPLIATEAAVPSDRKVEDRGMVVHTATYASAGGRHAAQSQPWFHRYDQ